MSEISAAHRFVVVADNQVTYRIVADKVEWEDDLIFFSTCGPDGLWQDVAVLASEGVTGIVRDDAWLLGPVIGPA